MAQQSMSKVTALLDMINSYEPKPNEPPKKYPTPEGSRDKKGQMEDWTYGSQFQLDASYGQNYEKRVHHSAPRSAMRSQHPQVSA